MHPIERLRWIARTEQERDCDLAAEAAFTIAELGETEPPAVLMACRRLVERHPACGPLWWVCARLVTAADPTVEASRAAGELRSSHVVAQAARALRGELAASDVLAVALPSDLGCDVLAHRSSSPVRLIGSYRSLRREIAAIGAVVEDVTGFGLDECETALEGTSIVLVEPCLAWPGGLLVEAEVAGVVDIARESGVAVWGLLGPGRVLPPALGEAAASLAGGDFASVPHESLARALDETGAGEPAAALRRSSCPTCPELVPKAPHGS